MSVSFGEVMKQTLSPDCISKQANYKKRNIVGAVDIGTNHFNA